jgi:antitoxin VapB
MEGPNVKQARLFRNGGDQAVRIPREFEFDIDEVSIRREGSRLIIEPLVPETLAQVLDSFTSVDWTLDPIEDRPPAPEEFF